MKTKQTLGVLLVLVLCIGMLAACGKKKQDQTTTPDTEPDTASLEQLDIAVGALKGPTAIGMVEMMEQTLKTIH